MNSTNARKVFGSVNSNIAGYTPLDYSSSVDGDDIKLDCSLGVNSDLLGNSVFEALHQFSQRSVVYQGRDVQVLNEGHYGEIKYYPHDDSVKDTLAEWYRSHGVGTEWLTGENFVMGNGSYDILCSINQLCLGPGRSVLGHSPQFTAYIDNVRYTGAEYDHVDFRKEDNYKFDADSYVSRMSSDHSLFIIENPNNPTGQMIPLTEIEKIAARALELDRILIVDEAYGDYLPFEASAINLAGKYPNILVTRSFSKGWGMAGLRIGYAVMSTATDTLDCLRKVELSFNCSGLARSLAKTVVESELQNGRDPFSIRGVVRSKLELLNEIEEINRKYGCSLRTAETCRSTPILMLYAEISDTAFDLQKHLMNYGLMTVSCGNYIGLDSRSVRIMLPEPENMALLLQILDDAARDMPE